MKRYRKKLNLLKKSLKNNTPLYIALSIIISAQACFLEKRVQISLSTDQEKTAVFEKIRDKWNGIQTLRGYFRITANIKGKQGSIKALLALTLPDNLRMELISPGGTTMAVMTLSGGIIRLYYPSDNVLFFGNADQNNITKVLGIGLKPEELLPLFIGMGYDLTRNPSRLFPDGNELIAEFQSDNHTIIFNVSLDPERIAVDGVTAVLIQENKLFAEVKYKEIVYRDNFAYPTLADIDFPSEDSSYKIRITNAQYLVSRLEDKIFTITPKEDVKIYRIEDIKVHGTLLFGEK
jgi:hypothetical protein